MAITLNDREEATCRAALAYMIKNNVGSVMSRCEIEELIDTMGPNSGKAFGVGYEPDPLMEQEE